MIDVARRGASEGGIDHEIARDLEHVAVSEAGFVVHDFALVGDALADDLADVFDHNFVLLDAAVRTRRERVRRGIRGRERSWWKESLIFESVEL